jgi:uncharacterized membrane protein
VTRPHLYWSASFRIRQYVRGSLWVVPFIGGIVGWGLSFAAVWAQEAASGASPWKYTPDTALTLLTAIVGATVGLTGFVVTVSVLVVQMATGTFSARYMRIWYRDRTLKAVLAVLIGTFIFSFSLLRRVEDPENVPNLGVSACGFLLGAGIVLFLVFLDRAVHRLRPVAVADLVARAGRVSMRSVAAIASSPRRKSDDDAITALVQRPAAFVVRSPRAGAIQAIHEAGLVAFARQHDSVVVLPHAVVNIVSRGGSLLQVHGDVTATPMLERSLARMVALGAERTIDQDPAFALRVLVDVAIRALSPAVNDPTTATQVIDHLEDTLTLIGSTPGLDGRWEFHDDEGELRLVVPAQRWDDYLSLGVTEIREYGSTSVQVVRRLRAMLLALRESVLPENAAAVERELAALEQMIARSFAGSVDAELAATWDRQGIGGARSLA